MDGAEDFVLAQARAGNREAFRTLVERHSRAVFRVAFRITGNEQDAEDVVQETFLQGLHASCRDSKRDPGSARWIHRIAANCAIDADPPPAETRRSRKAATRPSRSSPGWRARHRAPSAQAAGQQLRARIEAVLQALTPLERAAFTLRHLEQRPVEEISAALGQSPGATRHSIFRAVAKMRRELAPLVRTSS